MRVLLAMLLSLTLATAQAADESQVKQKWRTPYGLYLSALEAHAMKSARGDAIALIDVRTRAELKYAGIAALVDANIPLRFFQTERWSNKLSSFATDSNRHFVEDVLAWLAQHGGGLDTPIILLCQSGSRSPIAARKLHKAGFAEVYTLYEGFEGSKAKSGPRIGQRVVNGWKNAGLPWSYKLAPDTLYQPQRREAGAAAD